MTKSFRGMSLVMALIFLTGCSPGSQTVQNSLESPSPVNTANAEKPSPASLTTVSAETDAAHLEPVSPSFSLMGRVTKSLDKYSPTPDSPQAQYELTVKIKNTGESAIEYDLIDWSLIPDKAKPEHIEQTSRKPENQSVILTQTIKSGEEKQVELATFGKFTEILDSSAGKPVGFEITLKRKRKAVAGPFRAELSNLNELPITKEGESPAAVYLKFQTGQQKID